MAVVIADHWSGAGNFQKAIQWGREALEHCRANYFVKEGIAVADKLIEWMGSKPEDSAGQTALFEVMMIKENFLFLLARREEEIKVLKDLESLAESIDSEDLKLKVIERLGRMEMFRGELKRAREVLSEVMANDGIIQDEELHGKLNYDMAILCLKQWKAKEALGFAEKASEIFQRIGNLDFQSMILNAMGTIYWREESPRNGLGYFQKAYELSLKTRNRWFQGNILGNMGAVYNNMKMKDKAREYYDRALAIHREQGNQLSEAHVLANIGVLYLEQEKYKESSEYYAKALELYRRSDNRLMELRTLGKMGRLYWKLKDYDRSEEYLRESIRLQKETGLTKDDPETRISLAELYLETGRLDEAMDQLEVALKAGIELDYSDDVVNTYCLMSRVALMQGNREQAEAFHTKAEEVAQLDYETTEENVVRLEEIRRMLDD
jgi:tetratricopeptide (TPR) repeat protein